MIRIAFMAVLTLGLFISDIQAQESVNSGGSDGVGDGSFSLSIGQVLFTTAQPNGDDSDFNLGVQIPREYFESTCPEDINEDGFVDIEDFIQFNSAYGDSCTSCREDINRDGVVGIEDFIQLNSAYGDACGSGS